MTGPSAARPASAADLSAIAGLFGTLPNSYLEALRVSDGIDGEVCSPDGSCGGWLSLAPAEEMMALNQGAFWHEQFPGLLQIGSNGGGTGFFVDVSMRPHGFEFVSMPMDDLGTSDSDESERRFPTFELLLESISEHD